MDVFLLHHYISIIVEETQTKMGIIEDGLLGSFKILYSPAIF